VSSSNWRQQVLLLCAVFYLCQVNGERVVIQELQVTPMGIIQMIYPNNTDTQSRLGIDVFQQVGCSVIGLVDAVLVGYGCRWFAGCSFRGAVAVVGSVGAVSGG
jgi:hypothetical protein